MVEVLMLTLPLLMATAVTTQAQPVGDVPFRQETAERYSLDSPEANDVRSVAIDAQGNVWAATRAGVYTLPKTSNRWKAVEAPQGPAFVAFADSRGAVWIGAWDGLYRVAGDGLQKISGIAQPVSALCEVDGAILAFGPDGMWRVRGDSVTSQRLPCARSVRAVLPDGNGGVWIGTDVGLFHYSPSETIWRFDEDYLLSASVRGLAFAPDGSLWIADWVGSPSIVTANGWDN